MKKTISVLLVALILMSGVFSTGNVFSVQVKAEESGHLSSHTTTTIPALDPNCYDGGFTAGVYCSECGKYVDGHEIIEKLGHADEDGDGYCDRCGVDMAVADEVCKFCGKVHSGQFDFVTKLMHTIMYLIRRFLSVLRTINLVTAPDWNYNVDEDHVVETDEFGNGYVDNEIIILFKNDVADAEIQSIVNSIEGKIIGYAWNIYQVQIESTDFADIQTICDNLNKKN